MKLNRNIKSKEAGLTFEEIASLAEEIRQVLVGAAAVLISEYIALARKITFFELGRRKSFAIYYEILLEGYFPDEVIEILRTKVLQCQAYQYNESDNIFFRENFFRGVEWLASRFYTDKEDIMRQARTLGLESGDQKDEKEGKDKKEEDSVIRRCVQSNYEGTPADRSLCIE